MLRQALHDAEDRKLKEEAAAAAAAAADATETVTLKQMQQKGRAPGNYGATTHDSFEDEDDEEAQSLLVVDDSDEDDDEEDEDEEEEEEGEPLPSYVRLWESVKHVVRVVANVENLWDDYPPSLSYPQQQQLNPEQLQQQQQQSRTRNLIVLFWFVVLALSYASERSTFKLMVDRAGPFRLFAVEMVTATHSVLLALGILIHMACIRKGRGQSHPNSNSFNNNPLSLGVSVVDVGLMALLETIQLLLVFLTGLNVPPTLTVILIQFTLPLTAFLTQFVHPDGRCSCNRTTTTATTNDANTHNAGNSSSSGSGSPITQETTTSPANGNGNNTHNHNASDIPPPPPLPPPTTSTSRDRYGNARGSTAITSTTNNDTSDLSHHSSVSAMDRADDDSRVAAAMMLNTENRNSYNSGSTNWEGRTIEGCGGLSAEHVGGSLLIFLAVVFALVPAFYAIGNPDFFQYADTIPIRTAYNTLLYVSSCIPAAASQLYKEHIFLQYKQPVNVAYLNLLLSIFQLIFASIISPLIFLLQGLGAKGDYTHLGEWPRLYPSSKFSENYLDGLKCFFGRLSDNDQLNKYYDDARCDFALGLVVIHCMSIIFVGVAVDKIVNAGSTKVMYRGMSTGIVVAVLCMYAYDRQIIEFSYGPFIDGLNLACLILLILGSEVYHRVALKELTFDTVYPLVQMETLYE